MRFWVSAVAVTAVLSLVLAAAALHLRGPKSETVEGVRENPSRNSVAGEGQVQKPVQPAANRAERDEFGDWRLVCREHTMRCAVVQAHTAGENRQMVLRVAFAQDGSRFLGTFQTPRPVLLQSKVNVMMGTAIAQTIEFETCTAVQCQASDILDEEVTKALGDGNGVAVRYQSLSGEWISIPLSPRGLPEALAALRARH